MTRIEWIEKYMIEAEHLICENEVDKGLKILTGLLYEEPGYGSLHNHIGWAYMYYANDAAQAELHLKMAIRFNEAYAAAYLHLGTLFYRQGRYGEAIETLRAGVKQPNANKIVMLEHIAQAYELQSEWAMAIKTYKEAIAASISTHEVTHLTEGIKRCRKKRIALFFTF